MLYALSDSYGLGMGMSSTLVFFVIPIAREALHMPPFTKEKK